MFARFPVPLAILALSFSAAPGAAADLTVAATSNYLIDATVNGQPVHLRVDPEAPGYIILNPSTVRRLGLPRSMSSSETRIGPVRLTGSSKVAQIAIGGVTAKRRLVWIDREAVAGADGLISPSDLPFDHVTFAIRAPRHGEGMFQLPLLFQRGSGLYFPLRVGRAIVPIHFSLLKPDGMATAATGALLAEASGGSWAGEARSEVIDFGVARPVRPFALARPLDLNGLVVRSFLVRTSDNRGNMSLPPEPNADPNEVVVTAASRQRAKLQFELGLDRLSECSRLIWDNITQHMTLYCSNGPRAGPVGAGTDATTAG